MADREILEMYIDLDKSCLSDPERKEVMDMLYDYKDAFSLRDKIGTCPNIEVDIDVIDILDKEMKRLCYLVIPKEVYSPYSGPVMLISKKVTQDKAGVTDFKNLNVSIAKNKLAYPLHKDIFSVLGGSLCEALLVLDLKDTFHSLRLSENLTGYCESCHSLVALLTCAKKCLWD